MEEKKTYDRTYVVTISTEEYRELIDERAMFKCEAENNIDKYFAEHCKVLSLKTKCEKLQDELDRFRAFIHYNAAVEAAFCAFCHGHEEDADA